MNKLSLLLAVLCFATLAHAQSVGVGTTTPNASAQLDVFSATKGVLVPRFKTTDITKINTPAKGLLIYDSTANQFKVNIGIPAAPNWQPVLNAISGWSTTGNTGTDTSKNFMGTTDDNDIVFKRNGVQAGLLNASKFNTAWGVNALHLIMGSDFPFGARNTAVGHSALASNTNSNYNTAVGFQAVMNANGDYTGAGNENTGIGQQALFSVTSGARNVGIGSQALWGNSTGIENTALGTGAGYGSDGSNNIFIGSYAGWNAKGSNKLYINSSGYASANTLIYGEFDNKIVSVNGQLGVGKLPAAGNFAARLQVKQSIDAGASYSNNSISMEAANNTNHWDMWVADLDGNPSALQLYYNGGDNALGYFDATTGAYTMQSDRRLKKDITLRQSDIKNILQLQAYQYHYLHNKPTDKLSTGFIAQDVQKLFPDAVSETTMKNGEKRLGINYQYFTVLAIKGLQEQQKQIDNLQQQIDELKKMIMAK